MNSINLNHVTSPRSGLPRSHPGVRPGGRAHWGAAGEFMGWAQSEGTTWSVRATTSWRGSRGAMWIEWQSKVEALADHLQFLKLVLSGGEGS